MDALVNEIEIGGASKDYIYNKYTRSAYNPYISKSIDTNITQKRVNKLLKYELIKVLGQGSYGMVFDASINNKPKSANVALK